MEGEGGEVRESLDEVTLEARRDGEPGDGAWNVTYQVGEGGTSLRDSKAGGAGLRPSKEEEQEMRSEIGRTSCRERV